MRRLLLAGAVLGSALNSGGAGASQYHDAPRPVGIAVTKPGTADRVIGQCILAAAKVHRVPAAVLVILLDVEGGQLGRVSGNSNGTVDIGPIQVNEVWLPDLARHWHASVADSFPALRDSFCANVEAGAWILRQGLDEARGDFWTGVAYYHSHNPAYKAAYLRKVLAQALHFQAVEHLRPATPRVSAGIATAATPTTVSGN